MPADLADPNYWETAVLRSSGRFLMLAALAEQPRHGYEMARYISDLFGGCCTPSDAMIYPGIRDLLQAGLIACRTDTSGPRPRKTCSLTDEGRRIYHLAAQVLGAHLPALQRLVDAALSEAVPNDAPDGESRKETAL